MEKAVKQFKELMKKAKILALRKRKQREKLLTLQNEKAKEKSS